jgi:SAM-dependent methyltransferase
MRDSQTISVQIREHFLKQPRKNQYRLFKHNFDWMKPYIRPDDRVLELGCSHGLAREFMSYPNLVLSDVEKYPWSDQVLDAQNIDLPDNSVDVVFSHSILHHLSYPTMAFREIERILKPGGYYLVQDVKASWLFRLLLWITKIEDIDDTADPYDPAVPACGDSPWEGNNAIPDILMRRKEKLKEVCPQLVLLDWYHVHCILVMNSGGTTSFFPYIPLNDALLTVVEKVDRVLCGALPNVFALQQRMVFRKTIGDATA